MAEFTNLKQRKFMAKYGREAPQLPHDDDMTWEDAHVAGASMWNLNASDEHLIKGGYSQHQVVALNAVRAYRARHGKSHPAEDHTDL